MKHYTVTHGIALVLLLFFLAFIFVWLGRWNQNSTKTETFTSISTNVAIATCVRKPVDFSLWLKHHRKMGISRFYVRVEDTPELEDYLAAQPDIILEMGASDKTGNNYQTIQTRQVRFVNQSLEHAMQHGEIGWLFNIDADELLHGSLGWLSGVDAKYKTIKLKNVEAVYDGSETHCFSCRRFRKCGENGVKCRAYANGKGGGRVVTGVTQIGCHDFGYNGTHRGEFVYAADPTQLKVLHFDSCSFGAWAEKFKHMSHNQQSEIPFDYYHESMVAVKHAWETYAKHTQPNLDVEEIVTI